MSDNVIDWIVTVIQLIILSVMLAIIINFFNMTSDIHKIKEYIVSEDVYIERVK